MSWLGESGSALEIGSGAFDNTTELQPEDNFTLGCAARSIQGTVEQPYSYTAVIIMRVCQSIIFFLVSLSGIFLNILFVVLLVTYKKLRTLEFGMATQIVLCGIKSSFIALLGMVNCIANRWLFGVQMCRIVGAAYSIGYLVRTQLLFAFVINRFLLVFLPYCYPKFERVVIITLSLATWMITLALTITLYTLDCYDFQPNTWSCSFASSCSQSCALLGVIPTALITAPTAIIPIFLYAILFIKARKAKKDIAPSSEKQAYDWKATITFFLMFVSTFSLTLPNAIVALAIAIAHGEEDLPLGLHLLFILATNLPYLLASVDAIVLLRNRDVREIIDEIKEKIACKRSKQ